GGAGAAPDVRDGGAPTCLARVGHRRGPAWWLIAVAAESGPRTGPAVGGRLGSAGPSRGG
ncbi:hypothetical protein, partial [Streptomyces sp. ISL-11]|uniref:hypothetical protein n=1 Tax=Streptomyces sp. ISL-11 TaxID=2819174 RepID=UPI001BE87AAA